MIRGKDLFCFGLIFFLMIPFIFAQELIVDSRISEVIVYPQSAFVSRNARLKLRTTDRRVIFPDIIPEIDENSLRVSAKGTAEVKLLGAQLKREFLESSPVERIKKLQEEIERLEDEKRRFQNHNDVLRQEKDFLDSVRLFSGEQISKDLVTRTPQVKELDEILKFLSTKLKENYTLVMENELNIRAIDRKLESLRNELSQISNLERKKRVKRSIVVDLEVLKPGDLELSISYMVSNAFWQPIYDARASFEKSEVELISYGVIRQNTGEDWQDVVLSLSTAKPTVGGRMPYISPWFLRPYQPMIRKEGRMLQYNFNIASKESSRPEEKDIEYAEVKEKGIAIVYKLPQKADIKSDGSEHKLPVSSQVLRAEFEYFTYPRLSSFAYLGSRVTNAKELQLLAGRVNIFLEGDFVGTSSIDNIGPGEEFDLYLGIDENVKVKREQIEKKVDEVLVAGIPAPTKRTTFKYKTTIENYKNKKIKVNFFEAMPISEDERIKVKINNVSLEPKEKDWKDRKGIWRWELELEPGQKKEIFYSFSIEHPREMGVEGL